MSGMEKRKLLLELHEKVEYLYINFEGLDFQNEEPQKKIREIYDLIHDELNRI